MANIKSFLSVILTFHVAVYVQAELKILTNSSTYSVSLGSTKILNCEIQDLGANVVQWKYIEHNDIISEGHVINKPDAKGKYSIIHPQDTNSHWDLQIKNISKEDIGQYQCLVKDTSLSVTHTLSEIGVTTPTPQPGVSTDFDVTECCRNESVSEACLPACRPGGGSLFNLNITAVCAGDIMALLKCGTDGKNHAGCCLSRGVPQICLDFCMGQMPKDISEDHLICLNNIVSILSCLEEGQKILPGPPTQVSVVQRNQPNGAASLYVWWKPPTDNANLVTGYKVFYKFVGTDAYNSSVVGKLSDSAYYTITPAKIDAQYEVYVISVGVSGASQPSEKINILVNPVVERNETETAIIECCREKGVSDDCQSKLCTSDMLRKMDPNAILQCFSDLDKALPCLVGQRNHSGCCQRNGLPDKCLGFCSGQVPTYNWNFTSCVLRLPVIEACVQEGNAQIPGPPVNISLEVGMTTTDLSWSPAPGASASYYTVYYRPLVQRDLPYITEKVTGNTFFKMTNLQSRTKYEVQLTAANSKGTSLPSSTIVFFTYSYVLTTPAPVPTDPGIKYNETGCCIDKGIATHCVDLCNYTALTTAGIPFDLGFLCANDLVQAISCIADGRNHSQCCKRKGIPDNCLALCSFTEDTPLTADFIVCAPRTNEIAMCFKEGLYSLPRPPQQLSLVYVTSHTVTLSWQPPVPSGPAVDSYTVMYRYDESKAFQSSDTKYLEHIVHNLKPGTKYQFQVISRNENGTSSPTSVIEAVTASFNESEKSNCNFERKNDTRPVYGGSKIESITASADECKDACEDSSYAFQNCAAVSYNRNNRSCTIYTNSSGLQGPISESGVDTYYRKCNLVVSNATTNWTAKWVSRAECCNKTITSDTCRPACVNGDFSNPFLCEEEFDSVLACASDGRNHSDCCYQSGVPDVCLPICWGQKLDRNGAGAICLSYINEFLSCFSSGQGLLPSPPYLVRVLSKTTTSIKITWSRPHYNCAGADCKYQVIFNPLSSTSDRKIMIANTTTYEIKDLKPNTRYQVTVSASNRYGSSLPSPVDVILTEAINNVDITISVSPSQLAEVGQDIDMYCEVISSQSNTFIVSWIFNTKVLKKGRQLSMRQLAQSQEGNYTCSASDLDNPPVNKTYFLKMKYKPRVINPIGDQKFPNQKQIAVLSCEFYGQPDQIYWEKDDKNVYYYKDRFTSNVVSYSVPYTGKMKSVLQIYYAGDASYGSYSCVGKNKFGIASGHMLLTSVYPTIPPPSTITPPAERNVTQCCMDNQITGVCLEVCKFDLDVDMLVQNPMKYASCLVHVDAYIQCATDGKDHTKCCADNGVTQFCQSFCRGVPPADFDSTKMVDCIGDADTMLTCVEEGNKHLPSPPQNVMAILKENVIQVTWDKPKSNAEKVDHYYLKYNVSNKPGFTDIKTLSPDLNNFELKPLVEGVTYSISLVAENELGASQPSEVKNVTVRGLKPSVPVNFHASVVNGDNVLLTWEQPDNHAVVDNYTVLYSKQSDAKSKTEFLPVVTNTNSIQIHHLSPVTWYFFQVIANGPYGKSGPAKISIKTGLITSPKKSAAQQSSKNSVALGIGLTILALFLAGAAVAVFLYCKRKRKRGFPDAVSFENPQYGSDRRVQFSGLPEGPYESTTSANDQFGYAPLNEDLEEHHQPVSDKTNLTNRGGAATLDVDQIRFT